MEDILCHPWFLAALGLAVGGGIMVLGLAFALYKWGGKLFVAKLDNPGLVMCDQEAVIGALGRLQKSLEGRMDKLDTELTTIKNFQLKCQMALPNRYPTREEFNRLDDEQKEIWSAINHHRHSDNGGVIR